MNTAVIGAGYVGLVQASGLAALGHRVRVGERDERRIGMLAAGEVPIFEPDLDRLVSEGLANGLLSFHQSNLEAVEDAEVVFIALPTPPAADGSADTSIIETVVTEIGPHLREGALVVMKSTVPVGSAQRFQEMLDATGASSTVLSNPEFLREGSAVADFFHPDRIVIGTRNKAAALKMIDLYLKLDAPVLVTDPISSEMIKYGANAYLASRITFANAMANLCEAVGADAKDVLHGMGYDRRIGFHFFNPGPGYGGSCFPKDTRALVSIAENAGYDFALLKGVINVNAEQASRVVAKVEAACSGSVAGKTIGLWGLAFKAETDDIRESPAVALADLLSERGAVIRAYDPKVTADIVGVERVSDALNAAKGADVLLIATEWNEFKTVDLREVRAALAGDTIVDARNILDPDAVRRLGLTYEGIGR